MRPLSLLIGLILGGVIPPVVTAHDGPDGHHHSKIPPLAHAVRFEGFLTMITILEPQDPSQSPLPVTWKHRPDLAVLDAKNPKNKPILDNIRALHGAFMRDEETGNIYTVFPGAGLAVLKADLKEWTLIGGDKKLGGMNSHGGVAFKLGNTTLLAFASTNTREVVLCTTDGKIEATLGKPTAKEEFKDQHIADYFGGKTPDVYPMGKDKKPLGPDFNPTSVCYLPKEKLLAVTTGYSGGASGDFVLLATPGDGHSLKWTSGGFGRRGNKEGQLSTGHGISWVKDSNPTQVAVASRANHRRYTFNVADGKLVESVQLDPGFFVCGVDDAVLEGRKLSFYPLLNAVEGKKNAGVAVYEGKKKISVLVPGAEKGLEVMVHIHGASIISGPDGKGAFAIVQSWNPGSPPAVFELTVNTKAADKK